MRRRLLLVFVAMLAAAGWQLGAASQGTAAADRQLAAARHKATVEGDLKGAIELYRQIVAGTNDNRALAAQALLGMAECYQRLGDAEAQKIYKEILRKYPDQQNAANIARERLGRAMTGESTRGDRAVWTGGDVDLFGTVAPDGRLLSYVDWGTGNLMLRDLVANTSRPLTGNVTSFQHGGANYSAISRDGRQVAFEWASRSPSAVRSELRIASLDALGVPPARTIWSTTAGDSIRPFQWSHDDRRIAVLIEREDRTSQLGVLGVDGSLRLLTSLGWRGTGRAVFSPDSRYLAYDAAVPEGTRHEQIRIIATDASRENVALEDGSSNTVMGWSADGHHLLFASDRSGARALWALPVRDSKPDGPPFVVRTELASTWSLGLTSSGTMYLWKPSGAMYVAVMPLDLETGRLMAKPAFHRFIESRGRPQWSDDGKDLVYISCGPSGGGPCSIFVWSAETRSVKEIPHSLGYLDFPRLSPTGRTILTGGRDRKGRRGIYAIDVTNGETSLVLPVIPRLLDWSHDGTSFYYSTGQAGERFVTERDLQSGAERQVVKVPTECLNNLRLSPDRPMLGCVATDESNRPLKFVTMPVGGGASRVELRVDPGDEISFFWTWLPDARGVILLRSRAGSTDEMWHVPFGGTARKLEVDLSKWTGDDHFHVHPDGRQLAFVANAGEPGAEVWALENIMPRAGVKK